jgi:hypothetical protein
MSEENRGYKAGSEAGNKWNVGDVVPQPDLMENDYYRIGFKRGFDEKAEYKRPLRNLLVGPISPDVDFAEMKRNFDVYNDRNLYEKEPLDETPLDLSLYDDEEPSPKKQRKEGGGKSKKRRKSKKSKKARRSRKQKK